MMTANENNKIFLFYLHLEESSTKSFRNQYIFNTSIQSKCILRVIKLRTTIDLIKSCQQNLNHLGEIF